MKSDAKVLLGLLAGVAVGAIAGILLAPEKGSETRKKIKKGTSDVGDQLKSKFNEFIDNVKHRYNDAKAEAEDAANEVADKVERGVNKAKNEVKNAVS